MKKKSNDNYDASAQVKEQNILPLPCKLTRPCKQGNWDTWMVLDPWNQV